jgi:hypothetical protein
MPRSETSGQTPKHSKGATSARFYTCTIKAHRPLFSSDKVEYTNVVRATTPENAIGRFIVLFKALYPSYTAVMGDIKCFKTY